MSVIFIGGTPGKGKTLFVTYLMRKKYIHENLFRKLFNKPRYINIFTNYPIKFEKDVYSYKIGLEDLNKFTKHIPDSDFVFDEFSNYLDSLNYKDLPETLRMVFKTHRHASIKDIFLIDQHPSRIAKQIRVLVNEFYQIKKFTIIPFTGFAFISYVIYYNFDDYGKSVNVEKKDCSYDFVKKLKIFRYKKVFRSYDTKYMKVLYENEDYIRTDNYDSLLMSKSDIIDNFSLKFDSKDKRKMFAPRTLS